MSVMLAKKYTKKSSIGGWFVSEKLDGMRCFWDGGITRGMAAKDVGFSTNTSRLSTGLWSRLLKPIMAPDWWIDRLPKFPLDGELWMGHGNFQEVMSVCRRFEPDERWHKIEYKVFDSPAPHYFKGLPSDGYSIKLRSRNYTETLQLLETEVPQLVIQQKSLPSIRPHVFLDQMLEMVVSSGGEGLMIRNPYTPWEPIRSGSLLKYKPFNDDEATVAGYVWGFGKHEGRMGAMVVDWKGKRFELGTGFTDEERAVEVVADGMHEDKTGGAWMGAYASKLFPIGSKITFKYRELTDGGIPKEGRYYRKYEDT